ncbi:MAG: hypothetical protein ACLTGI_12620 [Hoylesella buccalis]
MKSKAFAIVTFSLGIVQILLILVSWFITATMPMSPVRSLLSSEGIRWFFGQFTYNLASPLLVWLILAGMALGALKQSGLSKAFTPSARKEYRQRFALKLVLLELSDLRRDYWFVDTHAPSHPAERDWSFVSK